MQRLLCADTQGCNKNKNVGVLGEIPSDNPYYRNRFVRWQSCGFFFPPTDQNRPSTAASERLHKATTWPTGPYESDLTAERTCSIGVTIHKPIPPCLTVETGSRSKSGFQRPDFSSSDCFSGKSGGEDAAETPQRRASGAFPMIAAPNAGGSCFNKRICHRSNK